MTNPEAFEVYKKRNQSHPSVVKGSIQSVVKPIVSENAAAARRHGVSGFMIDQAESAYRDVLKLAGVSSDDIEKSVQKFLKEDCDNPLKL